MLLTSLLSLACSVCLPKQLRTTFPGSGPAYSELGPPPSVLNQMPRQANLMEAVAQLRILRHV